MGRLPVSEVQSGLEKGLRGNIQSLGLADLLPLLEIFADFNNAEDLLKAFQNRQSELLSLTHGLVLRLTKEYFDLQQVVDDAMKAGVDGAYDTVLQHYNPTALQQTAEDTAAVKLQTASRRFLEQKRFERRLLATVFEEPSTPRCSGGPASWLRQSQRGPEIQVRLVADGVRSLRSLRSSVANITARLGQNGLDMASSFRCADDAYPNGKGFISVGQFLTFLTVQLGVFRQPGEVPLLLRLLEVLGKQRDTQMAPALLAAPELTTDPSGASLHSRDLADRRGSVNGNVLATVPVEAYRWPLAYQQAAELDIAFPAPGNLRAVASRSVSVPGKASVVALRDALLSLDLIGLLWGRKKPTWRRLLLDAHFTLLQEEYFHLERNAKQAAHPVAGQLLSQLAICGAQLAAARKPGATPRVPVPVLIAHLLGKALPLAPVTVHASVLMASEVNEERRTARIKGTPGVEQFVAFAMPLRGPPQLLHFINITSKANRGVAVSLANLSESGMLLHVKPSTDLKSGDWSTCVRLHYQVGTASGTVSVNAAGQVNVRFVPRLLRSPGFVLVESFQVDVDYPTTTHHKLQFAAKRPTSCGFSLGMPAGQVDGHQRISVVYEAVFSETTVSVDALENLASLPDEDIHMDQDEDAAALAKLPPAPEPLHNHATVLEMAENFDDVEADDADAGDPGDDEGETEVEVGAGLLRDRDQDRTNERMQTLLLQRNSIQALKPIPGYVALEPAVAPTSVPICITQDPAALPQAKLLTSATSPAGL